MDLLELDTQELMLAAPIPVVNRQTFVMETGCVHLVTAITMLVALHAEIVDLESLMKGVNGGIAIAAAEDAAIHAAEVVVVVVATVGVAVVTVTTVGVTDIILVPVPAVTAETDAVVVAGI